MKKAKPVVSRVSGGPYRSFSPTSEGEHPIDTLIGRRVPLHHLRRRIQVASRLLMSALAERRELWLTLEELLAERSGDREEAYFDAGFEHGFAAGRAQTIKERSGTNSRVEQLAAELRTRALLCDELSAQERVHALLSAAWCLYASPPHSAADHG